MTKKKVAWIDTETTGLSADRHGVVQLAVVVSVDDEIVDHRDYKMSIFTNDEIDQQALTIHGYTEEQIRAFPDPREQYGLFVEFLAQRCDKFNKSDKYYIGGYNVGFDNNFVFALASKCGDKYLGSYLDMRRVIDPLYYMGLLKYRGVIDLPDHKLETVASHFCVELKAHDAMSDILATVKIFNKVQKTLFPEVSNA